jgi:hypothetical protein
MRSVRSLSRLVDWTTLRAASACMAVPVAVVAIQIKIAMASGMTFAESFVHASAALSDLTTNGL